MLITGLHTVADVYCNSCHTVLGWKYVRAHPSIPRRAAEPLVLTRAPRQVEAFEESQKYKEGKCIIEKAKMRCDVGMAALE